MLLQDLKMKTWMLPAQFLSLMVSYKAWLYSKYSCFPVNCFYIRPVSLTTHVPRVFPACVEGGTVYAAGSAMRSTVACEQCFCLGGTRRCVRPRCLPPPPGCRPRPASGACCPQRYYCEHRTTKPPEKKHPHGKNKDNTKLFI